MKDIWGDEYSEEDKTHHDCPRCSAKLYNNKKEYSWWSFICIDCDWDFTEIDIWEDLIWRISKSSQRKR
tara:strand:- start:647 stop:853 length:207 start_codon:yes stop_codon:yes gene_type:complete